MLMINVSEDIRIYTSENTLLHKINKNNGKIVITNFLEPWELAKGL